MKFLLVRHGHSVSNQAGTFTGQLDVGLSETGQKQAELCCNYIYENYKVDKIYASDLIRACETAKPLADRLEQNIITDKRFREIYGGNWEGLTPGEIEKEYCEEYKAWFNDIGRARCSNGEKFEDVGKRAFVALKEIAEKESVDEIDSDKVIVVASHAGTIRALECMIRKVSFSDMASVGWVENASVTEIEYKRGTFTMLRKSINGSLEGLLTTVEGF